MATRVFIRTPEERSEKTVYIKNSQTQYVSKEQTNIQEFSWVESSLLRLFHPRSLFIVLSAFTWFIYFLWQNNWQIAFGSLTLGLVISFLLALESNDSKLSETTLGKIALLHLHPLNFITNLIGLLILIFGVWNQSIEFILVATTVILLGHIFGWSRVNSNFSQNKI